MLANELIHTVHFGVLQGMAMPKLNLKNAISAIEQQGALLVFPVKGKTLAPSLWSCFFGDEEMRWDWSEDGDNRVPTLWHLREELSRSDQVVYTKWYQGRATFFSQELFCALIKEIVALTDPLVALSSESKRLYRVLEEDSPLPTKELRALAELDGKEREGLFNRGLRQLWNRLLIVGYGEVEEGGFPSLAVGATRHIFEDMWDEAKKLSVSDQQEIMTRLLPQQSAFYKTYLRFVKEIRTHNTVSNQ